MSRRAIPLAERRCTRCGRGVADGVTFWRHRGFYRPQCNECFAAYRRELRAARAVEQGREPGMPGRPGRPVEESPEVLCAFWRRRGAEYEALAERVGDDDPLLARRLRRAAAAYRRWAAGAGEGVA